MIIRTLAALCCFIVAFPGIVFGQDVNPAAPPPSLRPGDKLEITVWNMPEMSGTFEIAPDGTLVHPLYRQITVTGIPLAEAEQRIGDYLSQRDARAQFVVRPQVAVTVGGAVGSPGIYHHPLSVTLSEALALAGGVSTEGRIDRVRLVRGGTTTMLDLRDPNSSATRVPVRSGDQILVERRTSVMRDVIGPAGSIIAAVSGVVLLILRAGNL